MPLTEPAGLTIVRLMEPALCLSCDLADVGSILNTDGRWQRMLRCKRLLCDNWREDDDEQLPVEVSPSIIMQLQSTPRDR